MTRDAGTGREASAVIPPAVDTVLPALWILILGGRWLGMQWMMAAGMIAAADAARIDAGLQRCYGALLIMTLVVIIVRKFEPGASGAQPDVQGAALQRGPEPNPGRRSRPTSKGARSD